MIAHSTAFYLLSFGAALLLLALAFLEPPSVSSTTIPILVGSTEIILLLAALCKALVFKLLTRQF